MITEGVEYYFVDSKLSMLYWWPGSGIEICLRTVGVGMRFNPIIQGLEYIYFKVLHCVAEVKTGGYLVRGIMAM